MASGVLPLQGGPQNPSVPFIAAASASFIAALAAGVVRPAPLPSASRA
ncbi:hypothetical protein [Lentzea guizhouensis]|nr:hypothetical protein [Lentzea guizhouensis]